MEYWIEELSETSAKPKVSLGDISSTNVVNATLELLARNAWQVYRVQWQGSKIPRGAVIRGHYEINWTQNSVVTALDTRTNQYRDIGTYSREVEFGGLDKNLQVMIIFLTVND